MNNETSARLRSLVNAAAQSAAEVDGLAGAVQSQAYSYTEENPLRRGKWGCEEEAFALKLIDEFNGGHLPLTEGTTLRTFLSEVLRCQPMRVSKKFVGDNSLGRKSFRRSTVARSPDESSAALVELRRLEDAFIAYVKREEEGKKKRSRPNDAPPSKVSSKRKRVENGPRSGREEVAIGSAAATGHMILGSGSKPAAQLSAHSDVQGFNSKGAPPELPPADGFATSRVTSCQVMPHGRDVNDLSSLSSSSVERLLASQGTMAMSHSRDQLHRYQRHPLPLDFAHGQVNTNTHWPTIQPQQWLYPPLQPQMHLAHQLHQAQLLQGSIANPSSNIPPHQQQVALNNSSALPDNKDSQRTGMQAPAIQLQQCQQQGMAHQAFASSIGAPPTNPLLAAMIQRNAQKQNVASQPGTSAGGDSSVNSHHAPLANPHLASFLHQQHSRLQEQQLAGQALGWAQSNPSSAGGSLEASGNVTSLADSSPASLLQQQLACLQQEQQPGSHMMANLLHQQNHSMHGAIESPRQTAESAQLPSTKGNSEGET